MSAGYVQLLDLVKHFGKVRALDGLTLDVAQGELVALLGPSGCGKTTALRALAGLQELDRGNLLVNGKDITFQKASHRNMGMVFQAYSLFPHLTAKENVEYGLKLRAHRLASGPRTNRAKEMLDLVGLSTHINHYPHQLSGGQQQRVALARALAIEPKVLLLDEPLSALDAKVRTQLREEIRRIQIELGTTTLFVTHDQEEALGIADRVGVMRNGILEQIANPAELYDRPKSAFVAEFVGLTNKVETNVNDNTVTLFGITIPSLPGSITSGRGIALIRPENLDVQPSTTGNGKVVSTSFLGALCRIMLRTNDGLALTAQIPSSATAGLSNGASVNISVHEVPLFVKAAE